MKSDRRAFLGAGIAATGLASTNLSRSAQAQDKTDQASSAGGKKFRMKYAPHFGMFKNLAGNDLEDQLRFVADQGFTAFEDNGMGRKPPETQEKLAKLMEKLGLEMGVFVATGDFKNPTFARKDKGFQEKVLSDMKNAVEVAKRVNAKWCTVVPGAIDITQEWDYQTANCIELLKRCCEICEPSGLIMVLEPLNHWANHPGLFLSKIPQGYQICRAVNHPSCKILFDIYHQQIQEGNLIPNMDKAWSEVAYFQIGDNPGRKEPTTGEINYKNIFKHLHGKGFTGVLGMEHGNSKRGAEGDQAVIDAYRECDAF